MGVLYSPSVVTDGLVLALDAANPKSYPGSGTTWNDLSGNGNNFTLTNGPTFDSGNGGSIVFDGTDDHGSRTTSSGDILDFTTQLSYNGWVYPIGDGLYIFTKNLNGGYADQQYGCSFESQRIAFILAGNPSFTSTVDTVPFNTWTNICGTWNGTVRKIYINGTLDVEQNFSTTPSFKPNLFIGWRNSGTSSHYFNGHISNLNLYNRALTPQEVLQNYNATKSRYNL